MRRHLAMTVLAAIVLVGAFGAHNATPIAAAATCRGSVIEQINGQTIRARFIATHATSCANGRRVLRSFLAKADRSERCNRASKRAPPTRGCSVGGFNCFRNGSTYCASPGGRSVMWKE